MEFKSQICTSVEESKRLLELGLKKETADMSYIPIVVNHKVEYRLDCSTPKSIDIPAWSLHRLMEILSYTPELSDFAIELQYDAMIIHIANAIEANNINKNYLENEKRNKNNNSRSNNLSIPCNHCVYIPYP